MNDSFSIMLSKYMEYVLIYELMLIMGVDL